MIASPGMHEMITERDLRQHAFAEPTDLCQLTFQEAITTSNISI